MTKDPAVYLQHILDCIVRIEDYVQDGREAFLVDTKTQDAVIRNLEVIGQERRKRPSPARVPECPTTRSARAAGR